MTKVLLDTDIGTDIDDAVCLAYLLAHPDCDLLGLMTVTGQGHQRAMLASALCQAAGRDVPIFVGTEAPLLVRQRQPEAPQARALAGLAHAVDFPTVTEGIEFMRHAVRASPGEIVLLTIGPLTNVALLFALDPELPGLLKAMVTMAGSFSGGASDDREWNVLCDPHAAAMVYRCPTSSHRSIGLNVTTQVTMSSAEVRERFRTPRLRPVLDLAEVWFEQREVVTFHDPIAAATLFDDSLCTFEDGTPGCHRGRPSGFLRPVLLGRRLTTSGHTGMSSFVAGSINMDLSVSVDRHPGSGRPSWAWRFTTTPRRQGREPGGPAACAGAAVRLVGAVGDDPFGEDLLLFLRGAGSTPYVDQQSDWPSGTAVCMYDSAGRARAHGRRCGRDQRGRSGRTVARTSMIEPRRTASARQPPCDSTASGGRSSSRSVTAAPSQSRRPAVHAAGHLLDAVDTTGAGDCSWERWPQRSRPESRPAVPESNTSSPE